MIIDLVYQEMVKEKAKEFDISLTKEQVESAGISAQKSIEDYNVEAGQAVMDAIVEVSVSKFPKPQPEGKKLFAFDNFNGDKGIIIAGSRKEAENLYREEYPDRKIAKHGHDYDAYYNNGCFITEKGVLNDMGGRFITCPW